MAGGAAGKGTALVLTARAKLEAAATALAFAQSKGQFNGGTSNAAEVAALVDPAVAAAITALTAIT